MTDRSRNLESSIARLLTIGTYGSIILIAIGVLLALAAGTSPLDVPPAFDLARIPGDVAALRPPGFLWLGIIGLLATPASRVAAALVGYLRTGERAMVLVSILVLVVIAIGVATGLAAG